MLPLGFGQLFKAVIRRRKKALAGSTTEQVKFSKPRQGLNFLYSNLSILRVRKSEIVATHFSSFPRGRRASKETESSSMPENESVVAGPQVLSGAMGMLR